MRLEHVRLPEKSHALEMAYKSYALPISVYDKHLAGYKKGISKIIKKGFSKDYPKQMENQI